MIGLGRRERSVDLRQLSERIHSCRADELDFYRSILDLSHAQHVAIVEGDTDALTRATEEKSRLMSLIDALDLKIAGLLDEVAYITGARSHACIYPDHAAATAASCDLNTKMAGVMAEILAAECANQQLLEQAITGVHDELTQIDAGGRAVRAYWGRGSAASAAGAIDEKA